ncbi:MAG: hypothetical protein M0Q12_11925 [Synergistaceae bacterium]|jgi:hypothetical protein|nr:hypothetical protein [Synergistaceae bacterium]
MKINMNIAEQKYIEKVWLILQEIQEKRQILQDENSIIDFPKEPSGFYLKALLSIEGGEMRWSAIIQARIEVIKGLARKGVVKIISEDDIMLGKIRLATTEKFDKFCGNIQKEHQTLEKIFNKETQKGNRKELSGPVCKLPEKTNWEDVEIKFEDEFGVEIFVRGKFFKKAGYEDLGMYKSGTKQKEPDVQWRFLLLLATIQELDKNKATVDNMAYSLGSNLNKAITKVNCEQIKSKLAKALQTVFGLEGDPFLPYKDYGFYQPKFKLKPLPVLRGKGEPFITGTGFDDNKQYLE